MENAVTEEEINRVICENNGMEFIGELLVAAKDYMRVSKCDGITYVVCKFNRGLDVCVPIVERLMKDFIAAPSYTKIFLTEKNKIVYSPFIEWTGKDAELVGGFYDEPAEALSRAIYHVYKEREKNANE